MDGKQMYEIHKAESERLGLQPIPWNALLFMEQAAWDQRAYEQDLRDRELPASLRELEKGHQHAHTD